MAGGRGQSVYLAILRNCGRPSQPSRHIRPVGQSIQHGCDYAPIYPASLLPDFSARVQTVDAQGNNRFHALLSAFEKLTGCPVVINTSFNIRGEPIVCLPEDAYRCFMCTDMDYLVIGNYIFEKSKQPDKEKYSKDQLSLILD